MTKQCQYLQVLTIENILVKCKPDNARNRTLNRVSVQTDAGGFLNVIQTALRGFH